MRPSLDPSRFAEAPVGVHGEALDCGRQTLACMVVGLTCEKTDAL